MKLKEWLQGKDMTLALSAGLFGFFSHAGFLAAFLEAGIIPTKMTGSSAGAIIAALYGAGYTVEEMKTVLYKLQKQDFWDPSVGLGLLKGEKFEHLLRDHLPDDFAKLKLPVFISTFDLKTFSTKIYSKDASLIKTVRASGSMPLLFQPVKYENAWLVDGGIADDFALKAVGRNEITIAHYLLGGTRKKLHENYLMKKYSSANRRIFTIEDRVLVNPYQLQHGPLAFEQAYEKASDYLLSEI